MVFLMKKGNHGVSLIVIAVTAYIFCLIQSPLAILLVCAFALFAEKDEWLNRQALQALVLSLVYSVTYLAISEVFILLLKFLGAIKVYTSVISDVREWFTGILYYAFLLVGIIGLLRVLKGKEGLPFLNKLVMPVQKLAQGFAPAAPQYAQQYAPQYAPVMAQTPVPPPAPSAPQAPVGPPQMADFCRSCGTPTSGGKFCMKCGAPL
ncbi:hypothetical protein FACS1894171_1130 [Clostridia bacterium]|nr:hypothetical protein FACS1894171_1130 [Clostridia bacterium]